MKLVFIYIARVVLNAVYGLMKLFPTGEQVCFFSRQSSTLTPDFELLISALRKARPEIQIKIICCRFAKAGDGALRFARALLKSMWYLSRSRVCVLDGYWPAVCLLHHKRSLKVIQIWHSNGKIKRSGYQTLGVKGGRNPAVARAVRMHRGYDYIIAGGTAWNPYYCSSFGVDESRLLNFGLPRMDLLSPEAKSSFRAEHQELEGKIVVLYAPTFRSKAIEAPTQLAELFAEPKYKLICRFHPRQAFLDEGGGQYDGYPEDTFALLAGCDWLITDYSSLALEAAALNKKTLYYLYDHEDYIRENGVNIDLFSVMPRSCCTEAKELFDIIDGSGYAAEELENYRAKYLPEQMGHATEKICKVIEDCFDGQEICDNGRREHEPLDTGTAKA